LADDTADNLVAACEICNSIAHNRHFRTRREKKAYILEQRASEKWQRRLARMEVTLITVDAVGQPIGVVTPDEKMSGDYIEVWEPAPPKSPIRNPFRMPMKISKPKPPQSIAPAPVEVAAPSGTFIERLLKLGQGGRQKLIRKSIVRHKGIVIR
jgi:hypothetical protein